MHQCPNQPDLRNICLTNKRDSNDSLFSELQIFDLIFIGN